MSREEWWEKVGSSMVRGEEWWDHWFLGMARYAATASKDPSTQVGSVIVDSRRVVKGIGYNGLPRGVCDAAERLSNREMKYKFVVHAEANALLNSSDTKGCTVYCTLHPCTSCSGLLIQAGISRVVCPPSNVRWAEDANTAKIMLAEAGVELVIYG